MNKAMKTGIVIALVVVVGVVVAMKSNRAKPTEDGTVDAPADPVAAQQPRPLPRLVDLGSGTCIPCKMMAPILEELRTEYAGRLHVDFYDVRESPGVGEHYGIRVIPTQVFYDAVGTELWRHEGFMSKEDILTKWSELGVDLDATDEAHAPNVESQ